MSRTPRPAPRRRRALGILLAVAAVASTVAGVVPSVAAVVATDRLLAADAVSGHRAGPPLHLVPTDGPVPGLQTGSLSVPGLGGGAHRVRVGVVEPPGRPTADLLFLHGHADRLDGHARLFAEFADAGVRVVSFDLPSHGESDAGPIDVWSPDDLAALAAAVVQATEQDPDRPFVLAGWSFGGLLATRIAQDPDQRAALGRPVRALVLESPAIAPLPFVGGDGVSRLRALTHDLRAPVVGPPSPASPFQDPVFAARLLAEATAAAATPVPAGPTTTVVVGGDEDDRYVDVRAVRRWAAEVAPTAGADVTTVRCAGARHGLDIEAWPVGPAARAVLVSAVVDTVGGVRPTVATEVGAACR